MALRPVALVTGAAKGIGRGIALRLAKDGFDVAINGRNDVNQHLEDVAAEITTLGRRVFIAIADVSSDDQVKAMVEDVVKNLGGLDIVRPHPGFHDTYPVLTRCPDGCERRYSIRLEDHCRQYVAMDGVLQVD